MQDLKKIIENVYTKCSDFGKKAYDKVDPGVKINHIKRMFYSKKDNFIANSISAYLIVKGYRPDFFNSEPL